MMSRHLALMAIALVLAAPASSAPAKTMRFPDGADTIVIPAASGLHFRAFAIDTDAAKFDGQVLLTGTYYLYGDMSLVLAPDAVSLVRLPRLKQHSWGEQFTIALTGGAAFGQAVLGKDSLAALKKKSSEEYVSGKVGVLADQVDLSLSCGDATITAHFVSISQPSQKFIGPELPEGDC